VADAPLLYQMNHSLLQLKRGRILDAAEIKHVDEAQMHCFILARVKAKHSAFSIQPPQLAISK
jgi:hypothetical protein